jgi:hypothetical protein
MWVEVLPQLLQILFTDFTVFRFIVLPSSTYLFAVGVEVVYLHLITLRHTHQSR